MRERRRSSDAAVSDFVGTMLLAGLVVMMGAAVAVAVGAELAKPVPPSASLSLAGVQAGDGTLSVLYRSGDEIPLEDLALTLQRGPAQPAHVAEEAWLTPHATRLRPGDTLVFALEPPVTHGERIVVRIHHNASGSTLAELGARAPTLSTVSATGGAQLAAWLTPDTIVADGSTSALLAVRVSHPAGAAGVASVTVDLRNLTTAAGSATALRALNDRGSDGDPQGADGNWSVLLQAPANTTPGTYNLTIHATDLSGSRVGSTWAHLRVSQNLAGAVGNLTGAMANITNATGNFTGNCYGCVVMNGNRTYEGTRIAAPTSENVSTFRFRNFTYDRQSPQRLDGDALVARVVGNTYAWSIYVDFEHLTPPQVPAPIPVITQLMMWNANSTTVWSPASNGYVRLVDLDLDLLDPAASGFTCTSGCTKPMTYRNANIQGNPTFLMAFMRDETNNFQTDELGIYAIDSVIG